jgi:uncharacterized membrane protein YfcA
MNYDLFDLTGNFGVVIIVLCYLGLQLERMRSTDLSYSLLNAAGAVLILISLTENFNLSAVIIEIFWIAISVIGIAKALRAR